MKDHNTILLHIFYATLPDLNCANSQGRFHYQGPHIYLLSNTA